MITDVILTICVIFFVCSLSTIAVIVLLTGVIDDHYKNTYSVSILSIILIVLLCYVGYMVFV